MPSSRIAAGAGLVFALLLPAAFLTSGTDIPKFTAPDADWVRWAADAQATGRASALLILLAAVAFLVFVDPLRRLLGDVPMATTAVGGGLLGVIGIVTALVLMGVASLRGGDSDATVVRAVIEVSTLGFVLSSTGFATLLGALGLVTLRAGVLPRWTGIVASAGAVAFLASHLTLVDPDYDDSVFGVGYPLGCLCLIVSSAATSVRISRGPAARSAPPLPSTR